MNNTYGPSYILPDGQVFKLQENGFHAHYEYEWHLAKKGELKVMKFYKRYLINEKQWIRVNDGTNMQYEYVVELPIKPITAQQYNSLIKFLDYLMYNNKEFVDVGIEEHSSGAKFSKNAIWFKHYEFKEYLPDDIIKEIRQQYDIMRMRGEIYGK